MAKSKEQKRREALERKRRHWGERWRAYSYLQYPCPGWHENNQRFGTEYANERATEAAASYFRYCKEVGYDQHGNEL